MRKGMGVLSIVLATFLLTVGSASSASVAYIAGNSVWLSSISGKQKKKLAAPRKDGYKWTEVAQSDNGKVLAVSRKPKKIATFNRFTLFSPAGKVLRKGSLTNENGWFLSAFPVSLDLTNKGVAVYGYSNTKGFFPNAIYEAGTYVRTVQKPYILEPLKITGAEWPTLYGNRLVSTDGQTSYVQPGRKSNPFAPAPDIGLLAFPEGIDIGRTDVAANGRVVGVELVDSGKIELYPITRMPTANGDAGFKLRPGACVLSAKGEASQITISGDGKTIAWQDKRGVMLAGAPDFSGSDPCRLTRRAKVLAAKGKFPSIGNARLK